MGQQYGWIPELGTIDTSRETLTLKFDVCCEELIKAALHRDQPLQAVYIDESFPKITGSVRDWMQILRNVPHRVRVLNRLVEQLRAHASKKFETKLQLDQCRKQQHMVIALTAEMFIRATVKQREQQNWTDAHKAGLERQEQKKRDAQDLIKEVPHGQIYEEKEAPIKSYVPQKFGTEITDSDGK